MKRKLAKPKPHFRNKWACPWTRYAITNCAITLETWSQWAADTSFHTEICSFRVWHVTVGGERANGPTMPMVIGTSVSTVYTAFPRPRDSEKNLELPSPEHRRQKDPCDRDWDSGPLSCWSDPRLNSIYPIVECPPPQTKLGQRKAEFNSKLASRKLPNCQEIISAAIDHSQLYY